MNARPDPAHAYPAHAFQEADALRHQELTLSGSYRWLVGYVVLFSLLPIIASSPNPWGPGRWMMHTTLHTVFPALLLLHIKSNCPETWKYIKACSKGLFDVWRVWPTAFILAFLYWIAMKVIQVHAEELFPYSLLWSTETTTPDNAAKEYSASFGYKFARWAYESLSAGIVEELTMKLFLLLCLPPRIRLFGFLLIATTLIMISHFPQPLGSILLKVPTFALPTVWYFYRTRNLSYLILFHVFIDLFLLAPFIFI